MSQTPLSLDEIAIWVSIKIYLHLYNVSSSVLICIYAFKTIFGVVLSLFKQIIHCFGVYKNNIS